MDKPETFFFQKRDSTLIYKQTKVGISYDHDLNRVSLEVVCIGFGHKPRTSLHKCVPLSFIFYILKFDNNNFKSLMDS